MRTKRNRKVWGTLRPLMIGASALALASTAHAQDASDTAAQKPENQKDEIIVTGTRITRAGFVAPTPTTVVNADAIARKAQTSALEILNELPSVRASLTTTTAGPSLRGAASAVDLRGLGAVRTLVLVNGLRAIPTTTAGLTDLNLIPSIAIDRVDVVTGGASAGYGSDAVSGIVNFVLKKEFDGVRADVSGGVSRYGDNTETRAGLLAGTRFGGDRGRVVLAGEYVKNAGIGDQYTRPWGSPVNLVYTNSVSNGLPQRLILPDVYISNTTLGGIITNASNVTAGNLATLKTIAFGPGSNPYTFNFGTLSSATQAVGVAVGTNPGAVTFVRNLSLSLPVERFSIYGRAGYDVADDIEFYVAGQAAGYKSSGVTFPQRTTVSINADNAYLPASVRSLMNSNSVLTVGREFEDSFGPSISTNKNRTYNGVVGLEGKFGGSWKWDVSAQFGQNTFDQVNAGQVLSTNLRNAADAVVVTAANVGTSGLALGSIACRSTLAAPTNGCTPFNVFGQGSPSEASQAYVRTTGTVHLVTKQTQVSANLSGEPFSTWAGPVSVAIGGEYRKESADQTVDANSAAGAFITGPANVKALQGAYTVKEAYLEVALPLAKDMTFAKNLELNGAVRRTDYSTSGTVTTWKVGGIYEPFAGLRFRATRSRDIRAPNLSELYTLAVTTNPNTLVNALSPNCTPTSTNPLAGCPGTGIINVRTSGNTSLQPEIAQTLALGVVIQPVQISGLSLSVDFYDINLKGAIAAIANQTILNQCAAGNQTLCDLITLDGSRNVLEIRNRPVNIASLRFRGLDIEAAYRMPLSALSSSLHGELRLTAMANRVIDAISDDGITGPIQRAGELGVQGGIGRPKWTITHGIDLDFTSWSIGLQGRYLSSGKYDNTWAEGVSGVPGTGGFTTNINRVPSIYYVNLNASVNVIQEDKRKLQFYLVVNNLLNKAPPVTPQGGGSINAALYDVIGQSFKVGARFSF